MAGYTSETGEHHGLETIGLGAAEGRGLRAAFAPTANMILYSLTIGGRELLAQRKGLDGYTGERKTMGVPLLHPWANRLGGFAYEAAGTRVELNPESPLLKVDPTGGPIHGAPPALLRWEVLAVDTGAEGASIRAHLDWDPGHPAFEIFPFPHRLEYAARLAGKAIRIEVTLEPRGEAAVPVSFGFHPYLRIEGGGRAAARMTVPARRRLVLDDKKIPTGETESFEAGARELGESAWDDGFADLPASPRFELAGAEGDVSLTFLRGYPFAQVFAPPETDFACFEPMTAPTNALVRGGPDLPIIAPGDRYETAFEIAAG